MKKIITILLLLGIVLTASKVSAQDNKIPSVIYKQANQVLLVSDILSWYNLSDAEVMLDTYTGQGNIPAIYDLEIKDADTTYAIKINVRQTLSDVIRAVAKVDNSYHLLINKSAQLTKEKIKEAMVNINAIDPGWFGSFNNNQYEAYAKNWNAPGTYSQTLTMASPSGLSDTFDLVIVVSNSDDQAYDFEVEKELTFFERNFVPIIAGLVIIIFFLIAFKGGKK